VPQNAYLTWPLSTRPRLDAFRCSATSNCEIATRLTLSVYTVERHPVNVYGKIDARGRADAVAFALRHGLVPVAHVSD